MALAAPHTASSAVPAAAGAASVAGLDPRPVVLFDWGETLMWVPGMIHDPERHLACVERIFATDLVPVLAEADRSLGFEHFIGCYREACRRQIAFSRETQREHSFAERFVLAMRLAGSRAPPTLEALAPIADALGHQVTLDARALDDALEVVETLARTCRLGVVSNYPHGPVVSASLERAGLLRYFETVVVSSDTGWLKPHAECYAPALRALPAAPGRTLMVGDDLTNDVRGAKALGLHTAWIAPHATEIDAAVDIHLTRLSQLPAHCERLFA